MGKLEAALADIETITQGTGPWWVWQPLFGGCGGN